MCATGALAGALTLGMLLPAGAAATPQEVRAELKTADASVGSLALDDRVSLDGGAAVFRFDQKRGGVPVDGGEAIVLDTAGDDAELVADKTDGEIAPPGEPVIGARQAIEVATDAVGATAFFEPPQAELVIDPEGDGRLAWRVSVPSERPLADFEVLVDATTGAVLKQLDLSWRATGAASLFLPNAVVENGGYENPPGTYDIGDRRDRDSLALTALRSPVQLLHLKDKRPCLKGNYAEVRLGRREKRVCRASRDWSGVTREANRFEPLMAYHHVDRTQDYLLNDLGIQSVQDNRQYLVANAFAYDNSFYLPSSDVIRLGTGGVDDGEDADVIVHEFGHAIQDAQRPGFGRSAEGGAMGEGFGDYLAEALSEESGAIEPDPGCVMEWDAVAYDIDIPSSPGICLRRTDVNRTVTEQRDFCEDDNQGRHEIHCVGEAWSSALWELRDELGDEDGMSVMDRVLVSSHPLLLRDDGFSEAAAALLRADEVLYPTGAPDDGAGDHCAEIRAEMVQREFLPSSFDC